MDIRLVDSSEDLSELTDALASAGRVALDCEAAGFHRYSDRLCLVQLTTGSRHYLIDPFAVPADELLRPILEDPEREIVMHGADFDMRLLDRDLGIRPRRLFDTQIAATLLGVEGVGLSALLERHFGIRLSKKYQRADWGIRPIPDEMMRYAALDTAHLMELADLLHEALVEADRLDWAQEEFEALAEIRYEQPDDTDPVSRIRAARDMTDREVHRLRAALEWRDTVARRRDRAPFRIAGDQVLAEVALQNPRSREALESIQGFNRSLAREEGPALLEALGEIGELPDEAIMGLPRSDHFGRGRPSPEVEERFLRLKELRNQRASDLGLERGVLISNSLLQKIAELNPRSMDQLHEASLLRNWQVHVLGSDLLAALSAPGYSGPRNPPA